jgi:peptidoglycan/LPS O-acetylase OafA/YrhL
MEKLAKLDRRWDIDWLRIVVVLMLVPYHTARIFDYEPFFIKNNQLTEALTYWFVRVGDAFAMELLFLLAGASTWFALRRRSGGRYTIERFQRLLIPFIFGLFVLAPPNAYFALRNHTNYQGSFIEFYPNFFQVSPAGFLDFTGGFTIAHLWFILFLFIFSLLALPLFLYLKGKSGLRAIKFLAGFLSRSGAIFLLVIPLFLTEWLIDLTSNLILFIFFYFIFFIYGYILIADERFDEPIDRYKRVALILGPVLYIVLGVLPDTIKPDWFGLIYYRSIFPWLAIIAALGYAKKYLNAPPKRKLSAAFLMYFGEASYPFYLLHQTVLVAIGFYVVLWSTVIPVKYITIAFITYIATIFIYEFVVRRTNVTRFLFGMGKKKISANLPTLEEDMQAN